MVFSSSFFFNISVISVIISPFSFLILFIWVFSVVSQFCLPFSKNQLWFYWFFSKISVSYLIFTIFSFYWILILFVLFFLILLGSGLGFCYFEIFFFLSKACVPIDFVWLHFYNICLRHLLLSSLISLLVHWFVSSICLVSM